MSKVLSFGLMLNSFPARVVLLCGSIAFYFSSHTPTLNYKEYVPVSA